MTESKELTFSATSPFTVSPCSGGGVVIIQSRQLTTNERYEKAFSNWEHFIEFIMDKLPPTTKPISPAIELKRGIGLDDDYDM